MKKILLLFAVVLICFSCKKLDDAGENETEQKKYPVTFTIADFTQEVTPLSINGTAKALNATDGDLKNYATDLMYSVYDAQSGTWIHDIKQVSANADFGKITDNLTAGTYDVFICAYKGYIDFPVGRPYYADLFSLQPPPSGTTTPCWDDTFVKRLRITVAATELNETVKLDRMVGGLEVNVEDAIPSNAARLELINYYEATLLYVSGVGQVGGGGGVKKSFDLTGDVGQRGKKYFMFIGGTKLLTEIGIIAYDKNDKVLVQKRIQNVRFYENQKTKLTGSLFNYTSGFNITVNPDWSDAGSTIIF